MTKSTRLHPHLDLTRNQTTTSKAVPFDPVFHTPEGPVSLTSKPRYQITVATSDLSFFATSL